MGAHSFGLIELIAFFGLLLGALGWQWLSIRRTLKADREKAARDAKPHAEPP